MKIGSSRASSISHDWSRSQSRSDWLAFSTLPSPWLLPSPLISAGGPTVAKPLNAPLHSSAAWLACRMHNHYIIIINACVCVGGVQQQNNFCFVPPPIFCQQSSIGNKWYTVYKIYLCNNSLAWNLPGKRKAQNNMITSVLTRLLPWNEWMWAAATLGLPGSLNALGAKSPFYLF